MELPADFMSLGRGSVTTIERMARYRPIGFLGRKEDEPSMAKNWLERTKRMLVQMHCTPDESLELRPLCYRMRLISGGFP